MSPTSNIEISKNINDISKFINKFSVYKYLYDFRTQDSTNFEVVYDNMILS